jgi:hypothetical protein
MTPMRIHMAVIAVLVTAGGVAAAPTSADAKQHKYVGIHPVGKAKASGFCYIEVPHVHVYEPVRADVLYRVHDDHYYFVGDPVPYGYDGPKVTYYGHHPVEIEFVVGADPHDHGAEYCYLDGPHHHYFTPGPTAKFEVKGDVYWYVGGPVPKPARLAQINGVYARLDYSPPVVEVEPPVGYVGAVVEVGVPPPPVVEAHGAVVAGAGVSAHAGIGVEVAVPAPSLEVRVGLPGVVVEEHHHHDVVYVDRHKHRKHKHRRGGRGHRKHGAKRFWR